MTISSGVQKLIEHYQQWEKEPQTRDLEGAISVDEVASRVASFYERIRGVVDWKEEHLLRKTAIERILKRRILIGKNGEDFAERFLQELIRGGHFPNNRIPVEKIDEVQTIINKYMFVEERRQTVEKEPAAKIEDWLWSVAAAEIEEALSLPRREKALIEFMFSELEPQVQIENRKNQKAPLSDEERKLQVYVAVQKALFKLDHATITYHILEKFYPGWQSSSEDTLLNIAKNFDRLYRSIKKIFSHPYSEKFYQLAEKYDTPYLLLGDILSENPDTFSKQTENLPELEETIKRAYGRRLLKLKGKIARAAFYSTLSVFLTKIAAALLIEIPLELYLLDSLNYTALGVSVATPPLLMIFLVATAKTSSQENLQRTMMGVMKIVHGADKKETYKIIPPRKQGASVMAAVYGMYLFTFIASFGAIVWILKKFDFTVFSIVIFLMFISLVSFAGTRIRQRAKELLMKPEREGFLYGIFDVFSLPMIQVGKWLTGQLVRYNVIAVMLNFLIEIPFQVFVEFLEQWRSFLKEKKQEIH